MGVTDQQESQADCGVQRSELGFISQNMFLRGYSKDPTNEFSVPLKNRMASNSLENAW